MKKFFILFLLFTIHYSLSTAVNAGDIPTKPKPAATPEMLAKGKTIYFKRCSFCHGLIGDGNGPAADFMDPRPRDFTIGTFKFRTTASCELPTDEDLFKTLPSNAYSIRIGMTPSHAKWNLHNPLETVQLLEQLVKK